MGQSPGFPLQTAVLLKPAYSTAVGGTLEGMP
jgi:hypothetical protein